jgi:hypothetical protein
MDKIREWLKNPIVMLVIGLVIGAIFGLVVLGWWLWPVQWTDASVSDLRYDAKVEVMRTCIDAFGYHGDAAKAKTCYDSIGDDAGAVLTEIVQNPSPQDPKLIAAFGTNAIAAAPTGAEQGAEVVGGTPPPPEGTLLPTVAAEGSSKSSVGSVFLGFLIVALLVGAALLILYFVRKRQAGDQPSVRQVGESTGTIEGGTTSVGHATDSSEPPVAQFIASFKLGDDSFNESFTVDSQSGEFLGSCGVNISETIGVGEPKRVSAFEVWLFDKNEIQTVTKVVMSGHAYYDNNIRQRLAVRGEPVLAEPGMDTLLDTTSFRLAVRAIDMAYGQGAMPPESYFDKLSLELIIWQK